MDNSGNINIGAPSMYPQKKGPDMTYIKIGGIALGVLLVLISIGVAIWSFTQYSDMKNNFDSRLASSEEEQTKTLEAQYEQKYQDRLKSPYLTLTGPTDYGSVTFSYPKTWSVYLAKDINASGTGDYEVYFNPDAVRAIGGSQQYAFRFSIVAKNYDSVVAEYSGLVKSGDLKSKSVSVNGVSATRLDGKLSTDFTGVAIVLVKIRDKTVIMRTDSANFVADFDKIIDSVTFVK